MSDYSRPRITWGNDFTIRIALQQFLNGEYVDFNLSTVKSLEVYLICSTHNQKIPLEWELEPGFDYVISCFVDYRVTHPNTSYGIGVEGIDENDNHFRWYMAGKEGILVVTNTSGQNIPQDVEIVDLSGRVGWGIQTNGDLTNYYTKDETEQYVQGELEDYYDKGETDALLDEKANSADLARVATTGSYNDLINKPTIPAAQVQSDYNQSDNTKVDYIKNKPNLGIYATKQELGNYYDKGETDGLLNNKVDTSTLVNDYYNKNTVDNLLDTKADTSDLNNYYDKTETNSLLNQKANTSDLNNYYDKTETNSLLNQKANVSDLNNKQDTLVSGENIKTVNNQSILGSGNIDIQVSQVQANWTETDTSDPSYIQNKPNLATVATSGDYDDLTNKPNLSQYATQTDLAGKQDTLVSGTNIKTVNNQSILGSGNIDIQGGGGENHDNADEATANALYELNERLSEAEVNIDIIPTEVQAKIDELEANVEQSLDELPPKFDEIDEEFKSTALVIKELHETAQPTLVSGTNIKTINNESILGSGNITISGSGVQSNWNETDTTSLAYIQNKPTIPNTGILYYTNPTYLTKGYVCKDLVDNPSYFNTNIGSCAFVLGNGNGGTTDKRIKATGILSISLGMATKAQANYSFAQGFYAEANGMCSQAQGWHTLAQNNYEHASGTFNNSTKTNTTFGDNGNTLFSIGNGGSPENKHNAIEIRQNGDLYIADTNNTTYSNYYEKPMIKLQDAMVTSTTNGLKIEVVSALPSQPENNVIYICTGNS